MNHFFFSQEQSEVRKMVGTKSFNEVFIGGEWIVYSETNERGDSNWGDAVYLGTATMKNTRHWPGGRRVRAITEIQLLMLTKEELAAQVLRLQADNAKLKQIVTNAAERIAAMTGELI